MGKKKKASKRTKFSTKVCKCGGKMWRVKNGSFRFCQVCGREEK